MQNKNYFLFYLLKQLRKARKGKSNSKEKAVEFSFLKSYFIIQEYKKKKQKAKMSLIT